MITAKEIENDLYHYTNEVGLMGILNSQSLWSTHYTNLNDDEEIIKFKKPLSKAIINKLNDSFNRKDKRSLSKQHNTPFETIVSEETKDIIDILYNNMQDKFFITSFCTHSDEYTRKNGLLSQWRGYGKEAGYALILDKEKLKELCVKEENMFNYGGIFLKDTIYEGTEKDYPEFEKGVRNIVEFAITNIIIGEKTEATETFPALVELTGRYKHQAFEEEKEIRLFSYFMDLKEEYKKIREENGEVIKPQKPIIENITKSRIVLFDNLNEKLPIKEIIVGPHQNKEPYKKELKKILRSKSLNIPVTISETPYVPQNH